MMNEDEEATPLVDTTPDGTDEIIPTKTSATDAKQRGVRKTRVPRDPTQRISRLKRDESAAAIAVKYAALVLLVAQMVGLVMLMRISRTTHDPEQPLYLASTAVFIMEVMKLVICCGVIAYQSGGQLFSELNKHIVQSPMEMLKLSVPSFLYTVQNNLLYLALTNLDAATYQVCYQLKILTTAIFSMILLEVRPCQVRHSRRS
jgi:Nucleotide-sugar transporter